MSGGRFTGDLNQAQPKPPNLDAVASVMAGYTPPGEASPSELRGVRVTAEGHIIVELAGGGGGAAGVVVGNKTPSDAFANPTDAIGSFALLGGWDRFAGTWSRVDCFQPIGTDYRALVIAGIGSGLYRYMANASGTVTFLPGGDIPVEVMTFPLVRVRGENDFVPPRAGYVGALPVGDSTVNAIPNMLAGGGFNSAAPTITNGDAAVLQVDNQANLLTQHGRPAASNRATPDHYFSASVARDVVKNTAGNVVRFDVSSAEATAQLWLLLLDQTTTPANGNVPVYARSLLSIAEAPGNVQVADFGPAGRYFANGIAYAISTTQNVVTLPGGFSGAVNVTYV